MSEEKRIFKKYTFYHNQFEEFTRALGALRILGLKHSFYNQAPPNINDELAYQVTPSGVDYRSPMIVTDQERYKGDWHIIEVYHE